MCCANRLCIFSLSGLRAMKVLVVLVLAVFTGEYEEKKCFYSFWSRTNFLLARSG